MMWGASGFVVATCNCFCSGACCPAGLVSVAFSWGCCWIMRTLDELMAGVNDDGTRQVFMALAVPVVGMLSVRGVEAGFGLWVALACYAMALGTLLYRERLDAFFWTHVIGENSNELFQLRNSHQRWREFRSWNSSLLSSPMQCVQKNASNRSRYSSVPSAMA